MNTTAPKPFVFVLMPFDREFDDVYQLGIKPACEKSGAYAERIDEQLFDESILDRIYNQISKADVIVSDMTQRNPNVFYETGYAHALGKRVILITKKAEDIPFDLKHYSHIIYEGRIADLLRDLTKKVAWALTQPKAPLERDNIQLFINGTLLPTEKEIFWLPSEFYGPDFELQIDAHNSSDNDFRTAKFRWGILIADSAEFVPGSFLRNREVFDCFKQSDDKILFVFKRRVALLPSSWKALKMTLYHKRGHLENGDSIFATIRLFFEYGTVDIPFSVVFQTA
jgi:hypothetical protein